MELMIHKLIRAKNHRIHTTQPPDALLRIRYHFQLLPVKIL
jgi:hypothetical protein